MTIHSIILICKVSRQVEMNRVSGAEEQVLIQLLTVEVGATKMAQEVHLLTLFQVMRIPKPHQMLHLKEQKHLLNW
jgi:hypothetical protein